MIVLTTRLAVVATILSSLTHPARAEQNQFWLAAQHDWGGKKGFFLTVGSEYAAGQIATRAGLRLTLGVADGENWHFLAHDAEWKLAQPYAAKAVITSGGAELWLDGTRVAQQDLKFVAAPGALAYNEMPSFLRGPADYAVQQTSLRASAGGETLSKDLRASALPLQLRLLNPAAGASREQLDSSGGATIEATFILQSAPDLRALAPFIDRYGQAVHADWPHKVKDDSQLRAAINEEQKSLSAWPAPTARDAFGGLTEAGWKLPPTGFFAVVKRSGFWWLITPEGHPCFYIGLDNAPALAWELTPIAGREYLFEALPDRTGAFAAAWAENPWRNAEEAGRPYVAFHTANLIRKYGEDWEARATESAIQRARALGFCGFGKWTPSGGVKQVPDVAVLYHGEIPNLVRHPDIFDPQIRQSWKQLLTRQLESRRNDPYLIGWSVGNEFDENIAAADIVKILAMAEDVPARRALIEHAIASIYGGDRGKWEAAWLTRPPAGDIESLRRFYAGAYYRFIYQTIKAIDPNHLYLGMWVTPNWWENSADWDLIAPYCDVIGYDFYARSFDSEPTGQLIAKYDKPVLCGEFSFPPDYGGERGYGRYHVATREEAEAGSLYVRWLDSAARNRNCVGVFYFQYRDQPITGRGPMISGAPLVAGENFAFGIVDVTDRLKGDFVRHVRQANLEAPATRLRESKGQQ